MSAPRAEKVRWTRPRLRVFTTARRRRKGKFGKRRRRERSDPFPQMQLFAEGLGKRACFIISAFCGLWRIQGEREVSIPLFNQRLSFFEHTPWPEKERKGSSSDKLLG